MAGSSRFIRGPCEKTTATRRLKAETRENHDPQTLRRENAALLRRRRSHQRTCPLLLWLLLPQRLPVAVLL